MVLIPEIRSIDFSFPISSVSSILFLVEPKRTGHMSNGPLICRKFTNGKKYQPRVCIHQPFFRTFFVLFSRFLAPLAEGQRAIVMVLCPSLVLPSLRSSVCACVRKLVLQKTSPQKLLTGFL